MTITGDVDLADERPLVDAVEAILATSGSGVTADLTGVEFLDSSGVRALLRLRLDHADRFCIDGMSSAVHRVLSVAGLLAHLGCDDETDRSEQAGQERTVDGERA